MANRRIGMVSPDRTHKVPKCVYGLNFNEVQSQFGNSWKPNFQNMENLNDELPNNLNLISSEPEPEPESGQVVQNPSSDSFLIPNSIVNSNVTISNKTLQEVWNEIVHAEHANLSVENNNHFLQHSALGHTTLQEFISLPGIINLGNQDDRHNNDVGIEPMVAPRHLQPDEWLQMQMQMQIPGIHVQQHQQQLCSDFSAVSKSAFENSVTESGYSENSMAISMPIESTCSNSKVGDCVARKQTHSDEYLEKTIERRKKRMAKNRESAARSRAKKQEHINKLETARVQLTKIHKRHEKLKESSTIGRFESRTQHTHVPIHSST